MTPNVYDLILGRSGTYKPLRPLFLFPILLSAISLLAAPVNRVFTYHQPDGSSLDVKVTGDEFYADEETPDGYRIIKDPVSHYWCYARLSSDGKKLESTGVHVIPNLAQLNGYSAIESSVASAKHLKAPREYRQEIKQARHARLNRDEKGRFIHPMLSNGSNNNTLSQDSALSSIVQGVAASTLGAKKGLTILIKFPDRLSDATITRAQVDAFCNQTSPRYSEFGNYGSVHDYFSEVSGGKLNYTNHVVDYYTAKYNRSYYADPNNLLAPYQLVEEALGALEAQKFDFKALDINNDGMIDGLNLFYAGHCPNEWAEGIWPCSFSYTWCSPSTGICIEGSQISDMSSVLTLGTFCHENGHMLCNFPDVYDYGYDSIGGGGIFDLMDEGSFLASGAVPNNWSGTRPAPPNAYLRYKAGWGSVDSIATFNGQKTLTTLSTYGNFVNQFLIYPKPNAPKEYYLIENLNNTSWYGSIPKGGIAVWHVDEYGNGDDQNYFHQSNHKNYEVALIQADNLRHFEHNINDGDNNDLFYLGNTATGYTNAFSDTSDPSNQDNNAHWWDGSYCGLRLSAFSAPGSTMTLSIDHPPLISAQPVSKVVIPGQTATFYVSASGTAPLSYQWSKQLPGGTATIIAGATAPSYTTPATALSDDGASFLVKVSNAAGSLTSKPAILNVAKKPDVPSIIAAPVVECGSTNNLVTLTAAIPAYDTVSLNVSPANAITNLTSYLNKDGKREWSYTAGATSPFTLTPVVTNPAGSTSGTQVKIYSVPTVLVSIPSPIVFGQAYWASIDRSPFPTGSRTNFKITNGTILNYGGDSTHSGARFTPANNPTVTMEVTEVDPSGIPIAHGSVQSDVKFPPVITAQPLQATVLAGHSATYAVSATGSGTLTYQWYKYFYMNSRMIIPGATSASYTTPPTTTADDKAVFCVVITNEYGSVTSISAPLTVNTNVTTAPIITTAPASTAVKVGETASFSVVATGEGRLNYQWYKSLYMQGRILIPGATSATYTTPPATLADNKAAFSVDVTNGYKTVTPSSGTLTVNP